MCGEQKRIVGILVAMATVGSFFIVVLGTGFRVTKDPTNPIGDGLYYGAIVVLALVIVGVVRSGWVGDVMSSLRGGRLGPIDRMRIRANERERAEGRRKRLEALAADPVKRKYVERIERGEAWVDEQIEYDLDPSRLATCVHLQPIERAMRDAGIEVLLEVLPSDSTRVSARCRVNADAINDQFSPPPFVEYTTPIPRGRAFEETLPAMLMCGQCRSVISVIHRLDAKPETPIFPPGAVDPPIEPDEASDRFAALHGRIQALAQVIDVPKYYLPTFRVPEGNGSPHIEIEGDAYHYVTSERGVEHERHTTGSLDDLLYWIFRDAAFSMAARIASAHQKPGEDFRRPLFREQLGLLRRLNREWEARGHLEHLETLARHPFVDEN
jgi:hypothetical protein